MKNLVKTVLTSILLGVLTLGSIAYAQNAEPAIRVNVPFDFAVGSQTFPAGRYSLAHIAPGLLEVRDSGGRVLATVLTQSVQALSAPDQPKLRFSLEGGQHVLTQVWQENESIGQQIPQSKSAVRAARKQSGRVQTAEVSTPR
jgi:hypothetical protein